VQSTARCIRDAVRQATARATVEFCAASALARRTSGTRLVVLAQVLVLGLISFGVAGTEEPVKVPERVAVIEFDVAKRLRAEKPNLGEELAAVVAKSLGDRYEPAPRDDVATAIDKLGSESTDLHDAVDPKAGVALGRFLKVGRLLVGRALSSHGRIVIELRMLDVEREAFGDVAREHVDRVSELPAAAVRLLEHFGLRDPEADIGAASELLALLRDLSRWDSASSTERRRAAQHVGQQTRAMAFKGMERFEAGGQSHEVALFDHEATGLEFALVPGVTFQMGSPEDEKDRGFYETQHRVTLSRAFLVARTECTQRAWDRIGGDDERRWRGEMLPIEGVSWDDVTAWCSESQLRLPTSAEWEHACRAGTTTPFNVGNDVSTREANYDGTYPYRGAKGRRRGRTVAVGRLSHNAFGLHDMHGNVFEWCQDSFTGDYPPATATDPVSTEESTVGRVIRGGAWLVQAQALRSARPSRANRWQRNDMLGFRPVCSVGVD